MAFAEVIRHEYLILPVIIAMAAVIIIQDSIHWVLTLFLALF